MDFEIKRMGIRIFNTKVPSSPEFPNQNLRQIGQGVTELSSEKEKKQTDMQTTRDYNFINIDVQYLHYNVHKGIMYCLYSPVLFY